MSDARLRYLPAPWLPLTYCAGAHLALLLACLVLVVCPELPGAFHYHPRMIALTHLVTLGWISGSILGALYIVAPLALGMTLPTGRADVVTAVAFWGAAGMVAGSGMGATTTSGRRRCPSRCADLGGCSRLERTANGACAWGVGLHIVLAFANVMVAALLGIVSALGRRAGWFDLPVLGIAMAHAHLAALGWAVVMMFGVSYRRVPVSCRARCPRARDWRGARRCSSAVPLHRVDAGHGRADAVAVGGMRDRGGWMLHLADAPGIEGCLLPMHAWYVAMRHAGGRPRRWRLTRSPKAGSLWRSSACGRLYCIWPSV